VSLNVFEEEPAQSVAKLFDDPIDVGKQVARIVFALSLSRLGKRLTGVTGKQCVDLSAPWSGVEQLEVVPDRGRVQVAGTLCGDEGFARVLFDFAVAGGGKARLGKAKTHVKSAAACTEGEAVSGR
jgi:hypothetical protein